MWLNSSLGYNVDVHVLPEPVLWGLTQCSAIVKRVWVMQCELLLDERIYFITQYKPGFGESVVEVSMTANIDCSNFRWPICLPHCFTQQVMYNVQCLNAVQHFLELWAVSPARTTWISSEIDRYCSVVTERTAIYVWLHDGIECKPFIPLVVLLKLEKKSENENLILVIKFIWLIKWILSIVNALPKD